MAQALADHLWQTYEMAWSGMQTEVHGHVALVLAFVAILILFWFFTLPQIKRK